MLDGVSSAVLHRSDRPNGAAPASGTGGAAAVKSAPSTAFPSEGPAVTIAASDIRNMATDAPVDASKVERLKTAIASGDYRPDPEKIAEAMIKSERE